MNKKRTSLLLAILAVAGVTAAIAGIEPRINIDADRLWTATVSPKLLAPEAFKSPGSGGHYVVIDAVCPAMVGKAITVQFVAAGTSVTNDVGAITNGVLVASGPIGIPPVRSGDRLLFTNPAADSAATNTVLVTYAALRSKDEGSR